MSVNSEYDYIEGEKPLFDQVIEAYSYRIVKPESIDEIRTRPAKVDAVSQIRGIEYGGDRSSYLEEVRSELVSCIERDGVWGDPSDSNCGVFPPSLEPVDGVSVEAWYDGRIRPESLLEASEFDGLG